MPENGRAVVVTTEHRGVFFGYVIADDKLPAEITLRNARNAVYWSQSVHGVLGLAATGPKKDCRIGPAIPQMMIWKITSVMACTPEAVSAWEDEKWA